MTWRRTRPCSSSRAHRWETVAALARKRFGGSLAGTPTVTAGCGGMGGAQPLAVTLNGGTCLTVDVDRTRLERRAAKRYLNEVAGHGSLSVEALE